MLRRHLAALLICVTLTPACAYHYRVKAPGAAGAGATVPKSEVVWSFFWGLAQETPNVDNCQGQALAEVHQTSNFGFTLVTVLTLGFAAPQKVEWTCAKAQPSPGTLDRVPSEP